MLNDNAYYEAKLRFYETKVDFANSNIELCEKSIRECDDNISRYSKQKVEHEARLAVEKEILAQLVRDITWHENFLAKDKE